MVSNTHLVLISWQYIHSSQTSQSLIVRSLLGVRVPWSVDTDGFSTCMLFHKQKGSCQLGEFTLMVEGKAGQLGMGFSDSVSSESMLKAEYLAGGPMFMLLHWGDVCMLPFLCFASGGDRVPVSLQDVPAQLCLVRTPSRYLHGNGSLSPTVIEQFAQKNGSVVEKKFVGPGEGPHCGPHQVETDCRFICSSVNDRISPALCIPQLMGLLDRPWPWKNIPSWQILIWRAGSSAPVVC